ncbi:hypothetical protein [Flavobacterium sp. 245]|uniref:hypothetical protein n=1 Tax=Flavobacterium sp. 245 TaxID=2512115 RepID=UPI0010600276|nr:hypothetical protein [Flavobacterium sp. 245]TDP01553.1 hypothetical protein EV145_104262 [Flavobacterium sp. 245]
MNYKTTSGLITALNNTQTKKDFFLIISNEFHLAIDFFMNKGYSINKINGLIGIQSIANYLDEYQYFRDLHYLYWGLYCAHWTHDPIEEKYYDNLKEIINNSYNTKS